MRTYRLLLAEHAPNHDYEAQGELMAVDASFEEVAGEEVVIGDLPHRGHDDMALDERADQQAPNERKRGGTLCLPHSTYICLLHCAFVRAAPKTLPRAPRARDASMTASSGHSADWRYNKQITVCSLVNYRVPATTAQHSHLASSSRFRGLIEMLRLWRASMRTSSCTNDCTILTRRPRLMSKSTIRS